MEKKKVELPKNYDDTDCWQCEDLIKTKSLAEVIKEHEDCHGWFHCGNECCGECLHCGN